ncbi:MAG TPA: carboxypeptidase-like regulatory domain-containing protein, partial [Anseongella sp.]|nr:carboxypeptidase-like regulatory domain-containing protein [Anseongella sp.]
MFRYICQGSDFLPGAARIRFLRPGPWHLLLSALVLSGGVFSELNAQVNVFGNVYDGKDLPLQGVSVTIKRSGIGVATSLYGSYSIKAYQGDTIEYSFLGFRKEYFAVTQAVGTARQDIHLYPDNLTLGQVQVLGRRNNVKDSLELRREFGHMFGYKPPSIWEYGGMALSSPITFLGEVLDFKGRRRDKQFQNTLLSHERQRFIESRIPYSLVTELTGLDGDERALFYNKYLRDYEFVKYASQ